MLDFSPTEEQRNSAMRTSRKADTQRAAVFSTRPPGTVLCPTSWDDS
jgi:hypothetical protein